MSTAWRIELSDIVEERDEEARRIELGGGTEEREADQCHTEELSVEEEHGEKKLTP